METFRRIESTLGQDGVALITVLFITVLSSTIVLALVSRQQLDFHRTGNIINSNKAYILAEGVVDWGAVVLERDLEESKVDNLGEDWAFGLQPVSLQGGFVSGALEDMQGRFNINNLMANDPDFRTHCREQFARMLDMCEADTDLVNSVIDWLDSDSEITMPGGSEDETYMVGEKPYRSANSLMTSPSELRLVAGFDSEEYNCLSPYISALPEDTYVNVNTTSAFVLASVSDNFTLEDGEDFVESRPDNGYKSVSDFFQDPLIIETNFFGPFLTIASEYFLADVKTELDSGKIDLFSLFQRKNNGVRVIQKGIGAY